MRGDGCPEDNSARGQLSQRPIECHDSEIPAGIVSVRILRPCIREVITTVLDLRLPQATWKNTHDDQTWPVLTLAVYASAWPCVRQTRWATKGHGAWVELRSELAILKAHTNKLRHTSPPAHSGGKPH
ncbi:hypothetical protein R1flu_016898 [Riccia fluitans]|uniref:Transposase n=1 Tax=Riccia fluitans TaxID=41844 RepID=A0ABD1YS32_9MARC